MHKLLSDLKTKVLADIHLFLDYWYLWIGIVAILIGLRLYIYFRRDTDDNGQG